MSVPLDVARGLSAVRSRLFYTFMYLACTLNGLRTPFCLEVLPLHHPPFWLPPVAVPSATVLPLWGAVFFAWWKPAYRNYKWILCLHHGSQNGYYFWQDPSGSRKTPLCGGSAPGTPRPSWRVGWVQCNEAPCLPLPVLGWGSHVSCSASGAAVQGHKGTAESHGGAARAVAGGRVQRFCGGHTPAGRRASETISH